jgi:Ser/Thr protein kinase RdoA (MazF antagonist)
MSDTDNEKELLETFVRMCRTVRDPRNRKSRPEMAIPAARWEMKFESRIAELKQIVSDSKPLAA